MADADSLFTEAPEEVTRYFDSKTSAPSWDWRDVAPHEHAISFTVAKSAGYDVLDDIRAALSEARRNNVDFGTFAEELEPLLRRKGWWGKARDPKTGKVVQLDRCTGCARSTGRTCPRRMRRGPGKRRGERAALCPSCSMSSPSPSRKGPCI